MCVFFLSLHYRFNVRDFEYDEKAIDAERKEKDGLEKDLKKQFVRSYVMYVCVCMLIITCGVYIVHVSTNLLL